MGLLLGEFNDTDLPCVPKIVTAINYMNQGRELRLGAYIYRLAETNDDGFNLVYRMKITGADGSERVEWYGYQGSLIHFTEMCNSLSDEAITKMQAEMALQAFNSHSERAWL